jgi:hypothetical protein
MERQDDRNMWTEVVNEVSKSWHRVPSNKKNSDYSKIIGFSMHFRLGAWFSSCRYGVELRVACPVCGLLLHQRNYGTSEWTADNL